MFDAFGFCLYGSTCLLRHDPQQSERALTAPPRTMEEGFAVLCEIGKYHMNNEFVTCGVCGFAGIHESHVVKIGETYSYRYCVNCTSYAYYPYALHLVELMVSTVGDDYQLYKDLADRFRKGLPDLLKIPFTYECHRIATTVFAWSLVSPLDAKFALETVNKYVPGFQTIVSVGSGTGYVEHVFNRVANRVGPVPRGPAGDFTGSFDGVHADFREDNKKVISFFSFDEIMRPAQFSVNVSYGGPSCLFSISCASAVLLLSWPPFGSPQEEQSSMGFETLRNYHRSGGQAVIYVGDVASTGDWRFHEYLYMNYQLVKEYYVRKELRRWLPQEMGLVYAGNDTIGVYVRRAASLATP